MKENYLKLIIILYRLRRVFQQTLINNYCIIDGLGIDNKNAQGAIHISGNNCIVENCSFIESGYRGYHIFIGSDCEKTIVQSNKFIGGNTNEPMIFISHSTDIKIKRNFFKDAGSWALHTDYVNNIVISENICENAKFDGVISSQNNQTVFKYNTKNMFAFPTFGIIVYSGSTVLKSGFTKMSEQGNITIRFEKGRKADEKIRCLAFKSAENLNINSRTYNCIISNNRLTNSGDSNITIASDYRGTAIDPRNTKTEDHPMDIIIKDNHLENAFGCNIAVSHTNNVNILNNTCINAGFAQFSTFYNSGISVPQGVKCTIEGNTIMNTREGTARIGILALENSIETKKFLRKNNFISIPNNYYLGAESDYNDFKSGVFIEGIYKIYGNLNKDINAVWKNNFLPFDSDFFSFDQHMNISSKDIKSNNNRITSIKISNINEGYFGINFKKISLLKNSLVRFQFEAVTQTSKGKGIAQILYKWNDNYQVKSIPIIGAILKKYEILIPFSNPQDIRLRLVSKKSNDIFYIQNIEISYLQI